MYAEPAGWDGGAGGAAGFKKGRAGDCGRGWGRKSPVVSPGISAGRPAGKTTLPGGPGGSARRGVSRASGRWCAGPGRTTRGAGERLLRERGCWAERRVTGPRRDRAGPERERRRARAAGRAACRGRAVQAGTRVCEGSGPSGLSRLGLTGLRGLLGFWVSYWVSIFLFYFLFFSFLNLIQTKFEFKYGFEFKPHSNKSMHQHECDTKY